MKLATHTATTRNTATSTGIHALVFFGAGVTWSWANTVVAETASVINEANGRRRKNGLSTY